MSTSDKFLWILLGGLAGIAIASAFFMVITIKTAINGSGENKPTRTPVKKKKKYRPLPKGWQIFKNNIM